MTIMFECSSPFRPIRKVERKPFMTRIIWLWFSVAIFRHGMNDMFDAFIKEGYEKAKQEKK
jgi:hypothetical protein